MFISLIVREIQELCLACLFLMPSRLSCKSPEEMLMAFWPQEMAWTSLEICNQVHILKHQKLISVLPLLLFYFPIGIGHQPVILELEAKDYRLVLGDSFSNHVTQTIWCWFPRFTCTDHSMLISLEFSTQDMKQPAFLLTWKWFCKKSRFCPKASPAINWTLCQDRGVTAQTIPLCEQILHHYFPKN